MSQHAHSSAPRSFTTVGVVGLGTIISRPDTILATNTSSLSVTEISVTNSRPSHVVGMPFFNPAPCSS